METLNTISSLGILTNKVLYDKKTKVFSVEVLNFMFVGNYKKSIRISKILDDIYASLGDIQLSRSELYFLDFNTGTKIHGNTKLKSLKIIAKKKLGKKEIEKKDSRKGKKDVTYEIEPEYYGVWYPTNIVNWTDSLNSSDSEIDVEVLGVG